MLLIGHQEQLGIFLIRTKLERTTPNRMGDFQQPWIVTHLLLFHDPFENMLGNDNVEHKEKHLELSIGLLKPKADQAVLPVHDFHFFQKLIGRIKDPSFVFHHKVEGKF